jgi:hypothetical protein
MMIFVFVFHHIRETYKKKFEGVVGCERGEGNGLTSHISMWSHN